MRPHIIGVYEDFCMYEQSDLIGYKDIDDFYGLLRNHNMFWRKVLDIGDVSAMINELTKIKEIYLRE